VSDQLELTEIEPSTAAPHRQRNWNTGQRAALIAVVLAVLVTGILLGTSRRGGSSPTGSPTVSASATVSSVAATARLAALRSLLRTRSEAVVHHDRAAFLATVDPQSSAFRRQQAAMFANLARIRFASWFYTVAPGSARLPAARRASYDAATWAPASFALHYRIAGFDAHPTDRPQYPTFVDRAGHWYLASLSDFRAQGELSATDLWDYVPVQVVRRPSVLVLGPHSQLATMDEVAEQAEAAIPKVTAVWGSHWARRVVVLVPPSQRVMGLVTSDSGDLDQIAALTTSEVSTDRGRAAPVGDRITINPRTWPSLGRIGAAVVVRHELTHVASRADTGRQTPTWVAEGFADYVGFRGVDIPVGQAAAELGAQVRASRVPMHLPTGRAFRGSGISLPRAYEVSWLACRSIAARYGQARLVQFYRAVGTSRRASAAAVTTALHRVLGLSRARFTALWRGYVKAELD
jgi:hypothetical protein